MYSIFQRNSKILFYILLILLPANIFAQNINDIYKTLDSKYGKDTRLYSGQKDVAERRCDLGNPFLFSDGAGVGSISLDGVVYDSLLLNYNVYDDRLVLEFTNVYGAIDHIVFLNKDVDWFQIDHRLYSKNHNESINRDFVEMVGNQDLLHCIFSFSKSYGFISNNAVTGYAYGDLQTRRYLVINGEPVSFKSKKSFIKRLPDNLKDGAKKFIKAQPLKFRKFDRDTFLNLCDKLNAL